MIRPMNLHIRVMNADGAGKKQITYNEGANFAPFFFPNDERIIFCSNMADPNGRNFDLWAVNTDGTNLERITYFDGFDGFPMFSPDGKFLVFSSIQIGIFSCASIRSLPIFLWNSSLL